MKRCAWCRRPVKLGSRWWLAGLLKWTKRFATLAWACMKLTRGRWSHKIGFDVSKNIWTYKGLHTKNPRESPALTCLGDRSGAMWPQYYICVGYLIPSIADLRRGTEQRLSIFCICRVLPCAGPSKLSTAIRLILKFSDVAQSDYQAVLLIVAGRCGFPNDSSRMESSESSDEGKRERERVGGH